MPNLYVMVKGDEILKCEESQVDGLVARGFQLFKADTPPDADVVADPPRGLVEMLKDGDTILCERNQVERFIALGYKERDPYEQLKDSDGGASSPVGSDAEAELPGSGADVGREGRDAQPAPEADAPDELPEDGSPEGDVVEEEKTPEQLVREAFLGQIREVLGGLDFDDDKLWAKHGAPLITVVEKRLGKDVTRDDIDEAWPGFARGS